jgi:hypothetical protein
VGPEPPHQEEGKQLALELQPRERSLGIPDEEMDEEMSRDVLTASEEDSSVILELHCT